MYENYSFKYIVTYIHNIKSRIYNIQINYYHNINDSNIAEIYCSIL